MDNAEITCSRVLPVGVIDHGMDGADQRYPRRPLRVCMVHYSDFVLDSRVQRHARALSERGDHVHCVSLTSSRRVPTAPGTLTLHQVRAEKRHTGIAAYLMGYTKFLIGALGKVTQLQRAERFDFIEIHNMPNLLAIVAGVPRAQGVPVVLDMHDTFPELFATKFDRSMDDPVVRLVKLEERISAALVNGVIAVTDEARARLASRDVGVGRTEVVMNSPDPRVFGPQRPPVQIPSTGPVRVVYHGGVDERFGVELLVRAFGLCGDRAPELELEVFGATDESTSLARLADEIAPGRIRVAPRPTPFRDIPGILAQCHVGVVPTLHDAFTELLLPVKLLEYVHMGIPVVASSLPAIRRYFSDDEVRYFEAGSAESLIDAVIELRRDPAGAAERARRASRKLEGFGWPRQRAAYLRLVDELTGTRAGLGHGLRRR